MYTIKPCCSDLWELRHLARELFPKFKDPVEQKQGNHPTSFACCLSLCYQASGKRTARGCLPLSSLSWREYGTSYTFGTYHPSLKVKLVRLCLLTSICCLTLAPYNDQYWILSSLAMRNICSWPHIWHPTMTPNTMPSISPLRQDPRKRKGALAKLYLKRCARRSTVLLVYSLEYSQKCRNGSAGLGTLRWTECWPYSVQ